MEKNRVTIDQLSDRDVIKSLYLSQCLILLIGLVLFLIFRLSIKDFQLNLSVYSIGIGLASGIIVVLIDLVMMNMVPKSYFDDGGINERVFKTLTISHAAFAMLLVAFSEEFLFRGVLQTKLGLIISSLIFACIHIRYMKKPLLLISVVVLSFFLGFIYHFTHQNLLTTIIAHFVIDFSLGLYIKKKQYSSQLPNEYLGNKHKEE